MFHCIIHQKQRIISKIRINFAFRYATRIE